MDWFKGSAGNRGDSNRRPNEFHRIKSVREKLSVELADVAKLMGISIEQAMQEEEPSSDLNLTQVHRWQRALRVPFRELLISEKDPMALPGLTLSRLVEMHQISEGMMASSHDSTISTFASELARQFLQLVDSAEQPFVDALANESQESDEDDENEGVAGVDPKPSEPSSAPIPLSGSGRIGPRFELQSTRDITKQFTDRKSRSVQTS